MLFCGFWAHLSLCRSAAPAQKRRHAREIPGGKGQQRLRLHFCGANEAGFAKASNRFHPAKDFFNTLAQFQPDAVVILLRDVFFHRGTSFFRCNVGGDIHGVQGLHKFGCVVTFVRTQRGTGAADGARGHLFGRFALGSARGLRDLDIHHQRRCCFPSRRDRDNAASVRNRAIFCTG